MMHFLLFIFNTIYLLPSLFFDKFKLNHFSSGKTIIKASDIPF